jgi:biopolymer transport protein ExbD
MILKQYRPSIQSLNVIPFIDILFQLIIFFSLVCQFIDTDNFKVSIPDRCKYAADKQDIRTQLTTVTVMKNKDNVDFAVGPEKITSQSRSATADKIAQLLDSRLKNLSPADRVVVLRIDKDVPYSDAQYALAGIAKSAACDIQLAVLKDKQ